MIYKFAIKTFQVCIFYNSKKKEKKINELLFKKASEKLLRPIYIQIALIIKNKEKINLSYLLKPSKIYHSLKIPNKHIFSALNFPHKMKTCMK